MEEAWPVVCYIQTPPPRRALSRRWFQRRGRWFLATGPGPRCSAGADSSIRPSWAVLWAVLWAGALVRRFYRVGAAGSSHVENLRGLFLSLRETATARLTHFLYLQLS